MSSEATSPSGEDGRAPRRPADAAFRARRAHAEALEADGQVLQAEWLYRQLLASSPGDPETVLGLARILVRRDDVEAARRLLDDAHASCPDHEAVLLECAMLRLAMDALDDAVDLLRRSLSRHPAHAVAWLLLADLEEERGRDMAALRARFEAVTRAMAAGHWRSPASTPSHLAQTVARAKDQVRNGRAQLLYGSYADLREQFGDEELRRVDRAVAGYLGEADVVPAGATQRPSFLYVPGLPPTAYHDPAWLPWIDRLQRAWPAMREEALGVLAAQPRLPDFVTVPAGRRMEDYVGGTSPAPSWEAFFFYRHGQRYDEHHRRCPATSAVLESLDLCRLPGQAPEILFSVLRAGSHIKPHHGTSNMRLVLHLPLVAPADCALNVVGVGEHAWQAGRPMLFDDTYLHEAWNRSAEDRIVLLMDCWHPHLSAIERRALTRLVETVTALSRANQGA